MLFKSNASQQGSACNHLLRRSFLSLFFAVVFISSLYNKKHGFFSLFTIEWLEIVWIESDLFNLFKDCSHRLRHRCRCHRNYRWHFGFLDFDSTNQFVQLLSLACTCTVTPISFGSMAKSLIPWCKCLVALVVHSLSICMQIKQLYVNKCSNFKRKNTCLWKLNAIMMLLHTSSPRHNANHLHAARFTFQCHWTTGITFFKQEIWAFF